MMLTREQRDHWADELESGRWEQCRGNLSTNYGAPGSAFCCLGVLYYRCATDPTSLPLDDYRRFIDLNDVEKLSFPEIAKHVRDLPTSD